MIVFDSMVLIHLAKLNLLDEALSHFSGSIIPKAVFIETVIEGKKRGFPDAFEIGKFVETKKLKVVSAGKASVSLIEEFGIVGGEAECLVLARKYRCPLATDDDAVRRRKELLRVPLLGTLPIIVILARNAAITKHKALSAISNSRKIGWFSSSVLDKARMVVENV